MLLASGSPIWLKKPRLARPGAPRVSSPVLVKQAVPTHCVSRYPVRVRFGETDLMGIVHHGTYISYFEVGRVEYMRRRGLDYHSWTELGIHLPVVEAYVRYRRTARFDELLCVETRLTELKRVRVRFDYRLLREPEGNGAAIDPDDQVVAEGHTLLACVDQHHIPRRIPAEAEAILTGPEREPPLQNGNGERRQRPAAVGSIHSEVDSALLVVPAERAAGSKA
jgi:acyl-CoA thioester hydrolase